MEPILSLPPMAWLWRNVLSVTVRVLPFAMRRHAQTSEGTGAAAAVAAAPGHVASEHDYR